MWAASNECLHCERKTVSEEVCQDCDVSRRHLCSACAQAHRDDNHTAGHRVISIDEYLKDPSTHPLAGDYVCSKHADEAFTEACKLCRQFVCLLSSDGDHQPCPMSTDGAGRHDPCPLEETAAGLKRQLQALKQKTEHQAASVTILLSTGKWATGVRCVSGPPAGHGTTGSSEGDTEGTEGSVAMKHELSELMERNSYSRVAAVDMLGCPNAAKVCWRAPAMIRQLEQILAHPLPDMSPPNTDCPKDISPYQPKKGDSQQSEGGDTGECKGATRSADDVPHLVTSPEQRTSPEQTDSGRQLGNPPAQALLCTTPKETNIYSETAEEPANSARVLPPCTSSSAASCQASPDSRFCADCEAPLGTPFHAILSPQDDEKPVAHCLAIPQTKGRYIVESLGCNGLAVYDTRNKKRACASSRTKYMRCCLSQDGKHCYCTRVDLLGKRSFVEKYGVSDDGRLSFDVDQEVGQWLVGISISAAVGLLAVGDQGLLTLKENCQRSIFLLSSDNLQKVRHIKPVEGWQSSFGVFAQPEWDTDGDRLYISDNLAVTCLSISGEPRQHWRAIMKAQVMSLRLVRGRLYVAFGMVKQVAVLSLHGGKVLRIIDCPEYPRGIWEDNTAARVVIASYPSEEVPQTHDPL